MVDYITRQQVEERLGGNCAIENNIIEDVNVVVTAHFGNTVSVQMSCNNISPFPLYNSTHNVGYIIKTLIELFDKSREDGVDLSALKNTPIRLVTNNHFGGRCVAIGHFMKDKFIFIEDLMRVQDPGLRARWVVTESATPEHVEFMCTECGRVIQCSYDLADQVDAVYPYCHCGAKMDSCISE